MEALRNGVHWVARFGFGSRGGALVGVMRSSLSFSLSLSLLLALSLFLLTRECRGDEWSGFHSLSLSLALSLSFSPSSVSLSLSVFLFFSLSLSLSLACSLQGIGEHLT